MNSSRQPKTLRALGKIGRPHGLRGGFFIAGRKHLLSEVDLAGPLFLGLSVEQAQPAQVQSHQLMKQRDVLKLDLLPDRTAVEAAFGLTLWISAAEELTYIGQTLYAAAGDKLGVVCDQEDHGAGLILSVRLQGGLMLDLPLAPTYFASTEPLTLLVPLSTFEGLEYEAAPAESEEP